MAGRPSERAHIEGAKRFAPFCLSAAGPPHGRPREGCAEARRGRLRAWGYITDIMELRDRITADMKDAMRAKAAARLSTIRLLLAAIKQREVDERKTLSDADVIAVIDRMVKQRKDSIAQFDAGHRPDLADAERAELTILEGYLPQRMSDAEIDAAIDAAIAAARSAGAAGPALMGKVMAALKPQLAGRADMGAVSAKVKTR